MSNYEINPKVGIGEVYFGMPIEELIKLGYRDRGFDESTNWHTYVKDDGFSCYVENELVYAISCEREVIYKGQQIIGMTKQDFIKLIGSEPDDISEPLWVGGDIPQITWEYSDLGMQVWFEGNRLVAVICDKADYDE